MSARIQLSQIVFDAGTQIRAAINETTVTDYAERMTEGAIFPPIVLFHDGSAYYLADGFHRALAAQRNQFRDIEADVEPGTKTDALWFALGANRANGQRLNAVDKEHAVAIALREWPQKMQREIAQQVGCHSSLVSKVYQKTTSSEPVLRGRALLTQTKRDAVKELIAAGGLDSEAIAKRAKVSRSLVSGVRAELGMPHLDRSRDAIIDRRDRMRALAAAGHTSRQIAAEVGLSEQGCRATMRNEGIDVPADRVTGKLRRHDATRIIEQMVMDAENLTADVNLIDFSAVDRASVPRWLDSLIASQKSLAAFIRRLKQETDTHGEAA